MSQRNVKQVKVHKVTTAQYNSMTKNQDEFYVVTDAPNYATETQLTQEATTRASADTNLQNQIDQKIPLSTKYGKSVELTMNSSTYVLTLNLKDQDGNNLGTTQTVDLPLETVVVSGRYDATTKKVILTLKDGSEISFSVADLVSGLQTEITSTNKLSSDLVDDTNKTHKFVSESEKTSWNNKVGSLSDLGITATATELNYTDGVTSNIQTQLNTEASTRDANDWALNDMFLSEQDARIDEDARLDAAITAEETARSNADTNLQTQINGKQSALSAGTGISLSNNTVAINQVAVVSSNITITGTLSDALGVISGFSSANYAAIPVTFNPGTDTFECVFKFKTASTLPSRYRYLVGSLQGDNCFVVGQYSDGKMAYWLSSVGSDTWDICSDLRGSHTLSTNTDYMVSVGYDGSVYVFSVSTNGGVSWETDATVTSSSTLHGSTIYLGSPYDRSDSTCWQSSIDLNYCGIKITEQGEVWNGRLTNTNIAKATENLYGLVKPDNSTITISDGVITGVSEIDDSSTTATKTWSASKLNTTIGNIESALLALRGNV